MKTQYNEHNTGFNPVVVKDLLLGMTVSPETGARLGVPAARLEAWLRELAESLDDKRRPAPPARHPARRDDNAWKLSAGELNFLLGDFESTDALGC